MLPVVAMESKFDSKMINHLIVTNEQAASNSLYLDPPGIGE